MSKISDCSKEYLNERIEIDPNEKWMVKCVEFGLEDVAVLDYMELPHTYSIENVLCYKFEDGSMWKCSNAYSAYKINY